VSRAARVSVPYLSEVERGRKEASSEVLAAICDALHIGLSGLLAEVWRELAADRARRAMGGPDLASEGASDAARDAGIIRLGDTSGRRASPSAQGRGPGDAVCRAA
jgi:transcriptional regulator with XRE-family HTH domain